MKIERDLDEARAARATGARFPHLLIWHGRRVCDARKPALRGLRADRSLPRRAASELPHRCSHRAVRSLARARRRLAVAIPSDTDALPRHRDRATRSRRAAEAGRDRDCVIGRVGRVRSGTRSFRRASQGWRYPRPCFAQPGVDEVRAETLPEQRAFVRAVRAGRRGRLARTSALPLAGLSATSSPPSCVVRAGRSRRSPASCRPARVRSSSCSPSWRTPHSRASATGFLPSSKPVSPSALDDVVPHQLAARGSRSARRRRGRARGSGPPCRRRRARCPGAG